MIDEPAAHLVPRPGTLDIAFEWFLRLLAAACMYFGVLYWVRLIGLYDGTLWRFDVMPLHWQIAAVTLAVLFPFAAVGLWLLASWGSVIWFLCAAIEAVMHGGFPELFGRKPEILAVHSAVAVIYAGFRLAFYIRKRRAAS